MTLGETAPPALAPMNETSHRYFFAPDPLLETICFLESRAAELEFGTRLHAVSPDGRAWGECQVRYWSARMVGFPATQNPGTLFGTENRVWGALVLEKCERDLKKRFGRADAVTMAHCYGTGKIDRKPPTMKSRGRVASYSKQIASDAATLRLRQMGWNAGIERKDADATH